VKWYSDASYLVSAFGEDSNTLEAKRWLRQCADFPILITRLTVLEAETALRAAVADGRLTQEKMQAAMADIHRSVLEGHLQRKDVPHHQWFRKGIESACMRPPDVSAVRWMCCMWRRRSL